MNVSTLVKILLALFLAAFLWLVITSIQSPGREPTPEEPQETLRAELIGIAEGVTTSIGDVAIEAEVQETYRNGEVHYQNFTMVQEKDDRTVTITGRAAQTRARGTEVDYFILSGDVVVDTSDGLHLETQTLNYAGNGERIFTQEESNFSLNELSGRSNQFLYEVKKERLTLRGNVIADYHLEADEKKGVEKREITIRGRIVVFDQLEHQLNIYDNARVSEGGSFIKGESLEAELTTDNSQFVRILVAKAASRALPDFGGAEEQTAPVEEETAPEEEAADSETDTETEAEEPTAAAEEEGPEAAMEGDANLSHHASGIKDIEANTMLLSFTTGDDNLLQTVKAEGAAKMEITPTGPDIRSGDAEFKRISGEEITAHIDTAGGGLKSLNVTSPKSISTLLQRPLFRNRKRAQADGLSREDKPRTTSAKAITLAINSETNAISSMVLKEKVKVVQGDLTVTADNGNYQAANESMVLSGKPVFKDNVKRVTGDSMTISMAIDDLAATGNVTSQFFKTDENPGADSRSVFAIGNEGGETMIKAGSLRLDYSNNILRYRDGVTINQGNTAIKSQSLDIFQVQEKLIAIGGVTANLTYQNATPETEQETTDNAQEGGGVFLSGEYLEINKTAGIVRVRNKARAIQQQMTFNAEEITYRLDENDRIISSQARREVTIDLGGPVLSGDTATIDPQKELLVVEGREVTFNDPGGMSGSSYRKIEYDMNTRSMKFFGQGNTPIKTQVLSLDEEESE